MAGDVMAALFNQDVQVTNLDIKDAKQKECILNKKSVPEPCMR